MNTVFNNQWYFNYNFIKSDFVFLLYYSFFFLRLKSGRTINHKNPYNIEFRFKENIIYISIPSTIPLVIHFKFKRC